MRFLPGELFVLHQQFVVEEALSVIRHDLRNKLGSIRNGAFYVRKKLEKTAPEIGAKDPRIPEFLAMIVSELDSAEGILQSRLPPVRSAEPVAASAILHRVRALVTFPTNVRVILDAATQPHVRICMDEATVALCCMIENALDAADGSEGTIRLRVGETDGHAAIEIEDDGPGFAAGAFDRALEPYFTTRPGRMGVGLNIARRVATRWGGRLAVAPLHRGVRAALVLRAEA